MRILPTALALVIGLGALPALAANARQPYSNVDRRNDRGNNTGDNQVPDLNQRSLDAARAANNQPQMPPTLGAPVYVQPGAPLPPGYVPLTPAYPGAPR